MAGMISGGTSSGSIGGMTSNLLPPPQSTCPNCGYCPHCKRGGYYVPYTPSVPIFPTYPTYSPYPVWVYQNANTVTSVKM